MGGSIGGRRRPAGSHWPRPRSQVFSRNISIKIHAMHPSIMFVCTLQVCSLSVCRRSAYKGCAYRLICSTFMKPVNVLNAHSRLHSPAESLRCGAAHSGQRASGEWRRELKESLLRFNFKAQFTAIKAVNIFGLMTTICHWSRRFDVFQ